MKPYQSVIEPRLQYKYLPAGCCHNGLRPDGTNLSTDPTKLWYTFDATGTDILIISQQTLKKRTHLEINLLSRFREYLHMEFTRDR